MRHERYAKRPEMRRSRPHGIGRFEPGAVCPVYGRLVRRSSGVLAADRRPVSRSGRQSQTARLVSRPCVLGGLLAGTMCRLLSAADYGGAAPAACGRSSMPGVRKRQVPSGGGGLEPRGLEPLSQVSERYAPQGVTRSPKLRWRRMRRRRCRCTRAHVRSPIERNRQGVEASSRAS